MARYWLIIPVILAGIACRKTMHPAATDYLGNYDAATGLLIHQAEIVFDSTALYDSLMQANPPTNRNYKWMALPDDGSAVFSDDYLHGRAVVSFNHQGAYQVFASVYDSASGALVARTNIFHFTVSADTLFQEVVFAAGDTLAISSDGYSAPDTSASHAIFYLNCITYASNLAGYQIPFTTDFGNGIKIDFADSAYLPSYPFYFSYFWPLTPVGAVVPIPGIPVGTSQPFSIVWQGQTYAGTISRPSNFSLSFGWNNTYPVIIVPGSVIE